MSRRDVLDLRDHLQHMLEAAARIERYLQGLDRAGFGADEMRQDAVLRNFEVLGEAAWNVHEHFPAFVAANPDGTWKAIYGMRDGLAHRDFLVDLDAVWEAARGALPDLAAELRRMLDTPEGPWNA